MIGSGQELESRPVQRPVVDDAKGARLTLTLAAQLQWLPGRGRHDELGGVRLQGRDDWLDGAADDSAGHQKVKAPGIPNRGGVERDGKENPIDAGRRCRKDAGSVIERPPPCRRPSSRT